MPRPHARPLASILRSQYGRPTPPLRVLLHPLHPLYNSANQQSPNNAKPQPVYVHTPAAPPQPPPPELKGFLDPFRLVLERTDLMDAVPYQRIRETGRFSYTQDPPGAHTSAVRRPEEVTEDMSAAQESLHLDRRFNENMAVLMDRAGRFRPKDAVRRGIRRELNQRLSMALGLPAETEVIKTSQYVESMGHFVHVLDETLPNVNADTVIGEHKKILLEVHAKFDTTDPGNNEWHASVAKFGLVVTLHDFPLAHRKRMKKMLPVEVEKRGPIRLKLAKQPRWFKTNATIADINLQVVTDNSVRRFLQDQKTFVVADAEYRLSIKYTAQNRYIMERIPTLPLVDPRAKPATRQREDPREEAHEDER